MTADEIKAREESDVFNLFIRLVRLPVRPGSIARPASGLDFECKLENGRDYTCELVKLDSAQTSRQAGNFLDTSSAWESAFKGMTEGRRHAYLERFKGYTIHSEFRNDPGSRERAKRVHKIVEALLDQPMGFMGALDVSGDRVVVERQSPALGTIPRGPSGTGNISITPEPAALINIRDKLIGKHYRVAGRFELVAYTRYDDLSQQEVENARADIREWLRGSPFDRVWILEWRFKRIFARVDCPREGAAAA